MKTCPHDINTKISRGKNKQKQKKDIIFGLNKSKSISDPLRILHCDIIYKTIKHISPKYTLL